MFPTAVKENRKRAGIVGEIDVFRGIFFWHDAVTKLECTKESFFEPPTDVRPSEGRITRVHEYDCFDNSLVKGLGEGDRVFLLFIQLQNGEVWPHFADERGLRKVGLWHEQVASELIACIDAKRPAKRAVIGFHDFQNQSNYCNGTK
jgi:hypothetical protein